MSPDDTLRALLHDAAENAPAYRPVDVDAELPITAFRRWAVLGLVAAAFVVIAAGGLVLSRTNDNADVLPPISDSTAPSRPTPSSHPSNEASRGMSPDGNRPDARRCAASAFRVAWFGSGVGAGNQSTYFTVRNTSSSACLVSAVGPAEVVGTRKDGRRDRLPVHGVEASDVQLTDAHQLAPGQFARFVVGGTGPMCDSPDNTAYTSLELDLGAAGPLVADFSEGQGPYVPGCVATVSGIGFTMPPGTTLPCTGPMSPSRALSQKIVNDYGEIDDCEAIDGAWIVDTDEGSTGVGSVGVHVCYWNCKDEVPTDISDWTFYHVAHDQGTDERLTGVDDGKILFRGAAGEVHFDPATGTWDVPVTLASPSR